MLEIVVHESAEEDLIAAAVFYESRETDLGNEFLEELSQSFHRIIEIPFSYGIYFGEYRRCLMSRFPYGVIYRIEGEQILVLLSRTCGVDPDTGELGILKRFELQV